MGSPAHGPAHVAKAAPSTAVGRVVEACATTRDVPMRERMRSGGLRGLQIPWSGASGVRGGFDSHAFPPSLLVALVLTLCLAGRASAGKALPDSLPQIPGIEVVNSDKVDAAKQAHADSIRARGWSAQPRFVMMRSLLIPGWGQAYNRAWFKAGLVAAGEVAFGVAIYNDTQKLDDLKKQLEPLEPGSPDYVA